MKLTDYFKKLLSLPFLNRSNKHSDHTKQIRVFIKNKFKISPKNIKLYTLATTHKSVSRGDLKSNERLEFLGDSILSTVLSEYLYNNYPSKDEGSLTKIRSNLSSRKFLRELACSININTIILKDNSLQMNKQRSLEGNALEAIFGAIFLDYGYSKTKSVILNCILKNNRSIDQIINFECSKSLLIEWSQKNKKSITWQMHDKKDGDKTLFTANIIIDNMIISKGSGRTKKEAQKKAAESALKKLSIKSIFDTIMYI